MRINYIIPSMLACLGFLATGCTDNSWNEHYIDGFDPNPSYEQAITVRYDLTKADYEAIGNGLYNKENSTEENNAANAIKSNLYFDQQSCYPMEVAVAYFLNQANTDFQVYDLGSKVQVGLTAAQGVPAELTSLSAAKRMILSSAPEASAIPNMLKTNFPDAEEGQYAVVSYPGTTTKSMAPAKTNRNVRKASTRADYWTPSYALSQIAGGFEGDATVGGYIISISDVSTSYGNATYVIADNASDSEGLTVYRGYYLDGEKFTSEDQIKVGDFVVVSGKLVNYNGTTPEFTSGNKIISINGEGDTSGGNGGSGNGGNTGGDNTGNGGGTSTDYWTPSYALSQIAGGFEGEATVGGYVIAITDISTSYGNATYVIGDTASSSDGLTVYRGYYLDGEKFTSEDQLKLGDFVIVSGSLVNYNGTTPEFTSGNKIISINGQGNGGSGSGGNTGGDNTGNGGGTNIEYWTPSYALSQIAGGFEGEATVGGYVISITDISPSYGNATYVIGDNASAADGLIVYRGYYLDGEKFTSEDQLKLGDFVIVSGSLVNYNGTTPEFTSGNKIISINGQGNGGSGSGGNTGGDVTGTIDEDTAVNLVYTYSGSAWSAAENAVTVSPDAYSQMGFTVNNLSNPSYFLPTYMKLAYPYIQTPTEMFVAYNIKSSGCASSLLIFDGSEWIVNDNYLQNRLCEFVKTSSGYQYRKDIGEETYYPFEQDEIMLNCGYLFVSGNYCAGPVEPTSGYFGYMYPQDITFNEEDGSVTLPTANNTFTFLSEIEINGVTYKTPEGKFLIQQADGNLIYLSGPTYYNFGIQSEPYYSTTNGEFKDSYLWAAEKQDDGTWMIYCDYVNNDVLYHKVIYYADNYKNFANYTDDQLSSHPDAVMINLYISEDYLDMLGNGDNGTDTEE